MKRAFWKMHGIGNDYIYFDCFDKEISSPSALAVRLSDRHFSIGGDGIVLIGRSAVADARMRMFNADGSEGKMCGNAVRCVAKYLYEVRGVKKPVLTVETLSGVKRVAVETDEEGHAASFTVGMGSPVSEPKKIPALFAGERIVNEPLEAGGKKYRVTCLSMGNPHCVVFCDLEQTDVANIGPLIERHPAFPERVNAEFVQCTGKNRLKMRVWERGSGETLACGTGACAAAVAAVWNGLCGENAPISVSLRGGTLEIAYTDGTVSMKGGAELVFRGEINL